MKLTEQQGFSLVELVVAMTLLAGVSIGIMTFAVPVINLWSFQKFQEGPANEGRLAMMRMVREIGQIKNDASVSVAQANNFSFTDTDGNTLTYTLTGTNLTRNAGNGAQVLAENVASFQLVYYDTNGNVIATPTVGASTDIRRVEMTVQVSADGKQRSYRSMAFPRNL